MTGDGATRQETLHVSREVAQCRSSGAGSWEAHVHPGNLRLWSAGDAATGTQWDLPLPSTSDLRWPPFPPVTQSCQVRPLAVPLPVSAPHRWALSLWPRRLPTAGGRLAAPPCADTQPRAFALFRMPEWRERAALPRVLPPGIAHSHPRPRSPTHQPLMCGPEVTPAWGWHLPHTTEGGRGHLNVCRAASPPMPVPSLVSVTVNFPCSGTQALVFLHRDPLGTLSCARCAGKSPSPHLLGAQRCSV